MPLNIPPEFERAILERVESGEYPSTDDVLRACLDALEREENEYEAKLAQLRADIQVGLDQYERGEFSDGKEVLTRLRARVGRRSAP
jgi:antitoxin ParD1/3/4